jgi:GTP pyrophosphokinase
MGEVKGQLEDLAFPYVYPSEHKKLLQEAKGLYDESNKVVERFRRDLLKDLTPQIPSAVINIRKKHLYSLFKKLKRPENGGDITKIYDLVAARIIVDTLENCYLALGIVHNLFRPVPYLGIKDYIASPKPNGYQSIHTRVFGPQGRIVEVQIRSQKMHEEAEMGITAHWMYSQLKAKGTSKSKFENFVVPEKLKWVQQLVTWQESVSDNDEFMRSLKLDTFQDRILVFTPIGDVYDLPIKSSPIDFAYAVHTDLGHQAHGAKINNNLIYE